MKHKHPASPYYRLTSDKEILPTSRLPRSTSGTELNPNSVIRSIAANTLDSAGTWMTAV